LPGKIGHAKAVEQPKYTQPQQSHHADAPQLKARRRLFRSRGGKGAVLAKRPRNASHYAATSLPPNQPIEKLAAIDALSNPLAIPSGQKNGKYEYCYQFSNSAIWLNLPSSVNSERHKVPNRHI
jgi:hypothetical protein